MARAALISVSDRNGIVELAQALTRAGFEILATTGTAKALKEGGVEATAIELYTGQPEILDGRVKTLHPKIHAGLLAKRDDPKHMAELEKSGIMPIDIAVVTLYPFLEMMEKGGDLVEYIDVGGPTMIRAAAKNHSGVAPIMDPSEYAELIAALSKHQAGQAVGTLEWRRGLAAKVFSRLSFYDSAVSSFLGNGESCGPRGTIGLEHRQTLRYGENPHQKASLHHWKRFGGSTEFPWEVLHGKELSYNNMLDLFAAQRLLSDLVQGPPTAAILKHLNPCGLARGSTLSEALGKSKQCDPRSHFGGIIVLSQNVDANTAQGIRDDFAELVVAPSYDAEALDILKTSKNLRIIRINDTTAPQLEVRSYGDVVLLHEMDRLRTNPREANVATDRKPTAREYDDLELAWMAVQHVKSNAITLCKEGLLVGVGAGQMSRIDSVELAIAKAKRHGHSLQGAVAASDAFFPFPDSVEVLAAEGISAIITPSGAKRDDDSVAAAKQHGVSLLFAPDRHFRH